MANNNNEIKLATLTNYRSLRALAVGMTLDQLEKIMINVTKVFEEQKLAIEAELKDQHERKARIDAIIQKMKADGITEAELAAFMSKDEIKQPSKRKKYAKRPAMYEYVDTNGHLKTWTGQGRTPSIIAKAIANGKLLSDFSVNKIPQAA